MKSRRQASRPVDRAVQELDAQIAQLERQLRRLETDRAPAPGTTPANMPEKVSAFIKTMLKPSATSVAASYHAPKDLFDVTATPLKDLEAEPIAFGPAATEPDLFGNGGAHAGAPGRFGPKEAKLARYLGAGSIRTYKPTKSIQRRDRNRFLTWIGLAAAALWVIYVVVR